MLYLETINIINYLSTSAKHEKGDAERHLLFLYNMDC